MRRLRLSLKEKARRIRLGQHRRIWEAGFGCDVGDVEMSDRPAALFTRVCSCSAPLSRLQEAFF